MRQYTDRYHGGRIGDNRGEDDYKMVATKFFSTNMDRQTSKGLLQTRYEEHQWSGRLRVLNSKIDLNKPLRTQLTVLRKDVVVNNLPLDTIYARSQSQEFLHKVIRPSGDSQKTDTNRQKVSQVEIQTERKKTYSDRTSKEIHRFRQTERKQIQTELQQEIHRRQTKTDRKSLR